MKTDIIHTLIDTFRHTVSDHFADVGKMVDLKKIWGGPSFSKAFRGPF